MGISYNHAHFEKTAFASFLGCIVRLQCSVVIYAHIRQGKNVIRIQILKHPELGIAVM